MVKSANAAKRVLRPPEVRGANRAAILGLLQHNDYLSRADVARQSGLSEGAISRIVTSLIEDGLVREDGAENSTGGRPGRRLALEPRRVSFGAEIQNWETRCAVSNMHGHIIETHRFRTPTSAEATLQGVASAFQAFRKKYGSDRLPGIGIAARGIVNCETGVLVLGSRPDWRNVRVREFLESRLSEPVLVENNVRAAALAEYTYATAEIAGRRCFVFVKVDEGVGMGVLFDGRLYHGPHMAAGELGQMVVEMADLDSGQEQRHDRPGCLEQLVSNPAVCQRYSELSEAKRMTSSGDTFARVRRIAELAGSGDAAARQTLEETARCLGVGISNVVWGLDADTIVLDGAITEGWPLVEPILRRQLPDYREVWGSRNLLVRPSVFGGEAALIGASTLPLSLIFAGKTAVPSSVPAIR
jgi:predicted NBD/HSP70 family sugar kinase